MIELFELAKEIHENAVKHGWWESERPTEEIFALIHSEWSEALEEARNNKPMIYYLTQSATDQCIKCEAMNRIPDNQSRLSCYGLPDDTCPLNRKPEGVAVELIDGCIRILDYLVHIGALNCKVINNFINILETCHSLDNESIPYIVCLLHSNLSYIWAGDSSIYQEVRVNNLFHVIALVFVWLEAHQINPMKVMRIKHEYNKTRPYKHGKKF